MDFTDVGRRIKKAREVNGITQERLAELVDLSSDHISVIERGIKAPRLESFIKIANALEVSADSLLSDVLMVSAELESSHISTMLERLSPAKKKKLLRVFDTMIREESGE